MNLIQWLSVLLTAMDSAQWMSILLIAIVVITVFVVCTASMIVPCMLSSLKTRMEEVEDGNLR